MNRVPIKGTQNSGSKAIGDHLRKIRTSMSISQARASYLSGLHQTTLNKIEAGTRGAGAKALGRLTTMYGTFTRQYYPSRYPEFKTWLVDLMQIIADESMNDGSDDPELKR